ncbi:MAG: AMP-binding protein [Endomicrobium sp.]|jgi:acetyl-CoA synthetase|nr:AMP-binding protein [Endomicrobium sp.]
MSLVSKYVKVNYESYEDFLKNYRVRIPTNFNFAFDVIDKLANISPLKKAMIWCNDRDEKKFFTFNDIKIESNRTANFLKYLNIQKGDAVMLILKRRYEYWFFTIALHKLGAIVIPTTHLLTPRELKYRIKIANIKSIIAINDDRILDIINSVRKEPLPITMKHFILVNGYSNNWINYTKEIKKFSETFERPTGEEETIISDKFLLYFTSGTSGNPKMVCHDFSYPLGHIVTALFWQRLNYKSVHLTVADTGWAKASWGKLYGQWLCGACIFVYDYDRFNAKNLIKKIEKYKITSFCAPPTVYRYIIKENLSEYNLSKLQYAETAGETLNREVFYKFKKITGLEIKEAFGQTESVVIAANFPWLKVKPGSVGKPSPGWKVDIVDKYNNSCETGAYGRLIIRTSINKPIGLFTGYYKNKRLTTDVWQNGIYDTGDIAYKDEDGYIWLMGRSDDIIKSSGYKISPFEIENTLMEHPCVLECAITGIPDKERGLLIKASIVLNKDYKASVKLMKNIQEHVKKNISSYKYPRIIEFVNKLPKTISGKIKRIDIRISNEYKKNKKGKK